MKSILLALSLLILSGAALADPEGSGNGLTVPRANSYNFFSVPFPTISDKPEWVQVFQDNNYGKISIDKASIRLEERFGIDYLVYREKQDLPAARCDGTPCMSITYYAMIPQKVAANGLLTQTFDLSGKMQGQSYYEIEGWDNMEVYGDSENGIANAVLEYLKKQVGQDKFGVPEHVKIGG
ncbi:hypothetical protein [Budvicia diplopodorum]|uniref:hypothetical protein n=1 Tax=Budvicia diplopodorum TaxID=1119056 RepID=UPI00135BBB78|nr:hypothetical protein [Budvicia diplopodorum]